MVLDLGGSSLIGERGPEVSDDGSLFITGQGNLIPLAIITTVGTEYNAWPYMYDNDMTTYSGPGKGGTTAFSDYNYTFDLNRIRKNLIISTYYGLYVEGGGDGTLLLQSSKDNITWTTLKTTTRNGAGTTYVNYTGNVDARYLRFEIDGDPTPHNMIISCKIFNISCDLVG